MAFLRKKTIKGKQYLYEVENTWEDGRVRQKVLRYVGPVNPIRKRKAETQPATDEPNNP